MIDQKKFLITTADERTWKSDQPKVFLGEWCRLFERKHIWQSMNAKVAEPYGLNLNQKDIDFHEVIRLEQKLFPEIYLLLNQFHGMKHDERYWSILIGHWFRAFLQLMINRLKTLEKCFQTEKISHTTVLDSEYASLSTPDIASSLLSFHNDQWNNVLYGRIINLINEDKIFINFLKGKNFYTYQSNKFNYKADTNSFKKRIINFINLSYYKIASKFVKNEDSFIINTYLSKINEFRLELALGQFPQRWQSLTPEISSKPDQELRKKLTKKFENKSIDKLETILRSLLFELIPVCYLEGLSNLYDVIDLQPWPKNPKFIFTSNNFYRDELFKLWTATKVVSGSKYYVGQHGNNYYTRKNKFPRIEEKTADRFITWGWSNKLSKYKEGFIFTTAGKNSSNYNSKGSLLLVETSQSLRFTTWDSTLEHIKYFDDQKIFVDNLAVGPKRKLIIRLNGLQKSRKFNEVSRWLDFDNKLNIDLGKTSIKSLINNSRLVVHSYDSSGILETLSNNIPTLAFWQNDLDHLREKVKPQYQLLIDVGILHLSSKSAANKINEIWNDVDNWWKQNLVQEARKSFCNSFAKDCIDPVKSMISILSS